MKKTLFILLIIGMMQSFAGANIVREGIASWYGGGEKLNKYTANGEVFDSNDYTCASWDFPFNTYLKITNKSNNKSVVVRVNDRGPNKRLGRLVDLTKEAFSKIGNLEKGLITVKLEKIE